MDQPAESLSQTQEQAEDQAPRRKRKPTGRLECELGLLLGLACLAASRLGQLWISFDVFSQFTAQFAVMTLAFLFGIFMPRGRLLTACVIMILGVLAIGIWPHVASREARAVAQAEAGERVLKVASFNSLWVNKDADAVRREVERIDADVIALVEMAPVSKPILEQMRERYPYQVHCNDLDYCNIAILSKLPIVDHEARGRDKGPSFVRVRLGPEAGGLTIFGVHTTRFPHSREQLKEVGDVATLVERAPGPRLVMGDFNATPYSRTLSVLQDSANLRRLTNLPSWPSQLGLPQIAIDHIFVSPGIRLIEPEQIGEPAGSDHYPIMLRIAVPRSD